MAQGIKIHDLPQTTSLEDDDLLVVEQLHGTKKITFSFIRNIKNLINYYTKTDIDNKYKILDDKINTKGTKDGSLQRNLNSDMIDGLHADHFQKNIVVSDKPPSNPAVGDLWIDINDV